MNVHAERASLPEDLATRLAAEPSRREFAGSEGRRYHLRESVAQLEQTVVTLLALACEEAGAPAVLGSLALLPLIERVIVEQAALLEGKPVAVELDVPATALFVLPAPVLHILLSNPIGNAFAHSTQGRVRIDFEAGCLRIANHGPRLVPEQTDALYAPFRKRVRAVLPAACASQLDFDALPDRADQR